MKEIILYGWVKNINCIVFIDFWTQNWFLFRPGFTLKIFWYKECIKHFSKGTLLAHAMAVNKVPSFKKNVWYFLAALMFGLYWNYSPPRILCNTRNLLNFLFFCCKKPFTMRKIGRTNVRQFSEKGWPKRRGFLYNMNTYLICDSLLWWSARRAALLRFVTETRRNRRSYVWTVVLYCMVWWRRQSYPTWCYNNLSLESISAGYQSDQTNRHWQTVLQ